jgi:thiosulfate dehydrogenase [quinone] large subunit
MLFTSSEYAWIWLVARVYLGIQWVEAGWHKMFDPSWMSGGQAVHDFWARIVIVPEQGRPAIAYDWYRQFIQFMLDNGWHVWFGKLIAVGETTVGIALLVGIFTASLPSLAQ